MKGRPRRVRYRPVQAPRKRRGEQRTRGRGGDRRGRRRSLHGAGRGGAGASVCLVSRSPLAQSASYWAQGGLAAALPPDDSVELHLEDTLRAGRGTVRALRRRDPLRGVAGPGARAGGARHPFRPLGRWGAEALARGRAHAATGRARGRQRDRPPRDRGAVGDRRRPRAHRGARAQQRARPVGRRRTLRRRASPTRARCSPRERPRHRRRGGAVGAHDQPARSDRRRDDARARRGRRARRPRVRPVPSDRAAGRRRDGRVPRHRGGARRGRRCCVDARGERFVDELAPARRGRACDPRAAPRRRRPACGWTCAASTRALSRTSPRRSRAPGSIPPAT